MSYKPSYSKGDWLVICDDCGRKYKASALKKRWDGLMVCSNTCWEPRQPQDFVRGVADTQVPSYTRVEQADTFIDVDGIYTIPATPSGTFNQS